MTNFPANLEKALKPLEELGMNLEEAKLAAAGFAELTRQVFEARIQREFSAEQMGEFNQLEGSLDPAGAISKLEEEYQKKTGRNFLDLYSEVFGEVVETVAQAGREALGNFTKLKQLGSGEVTRFVEAVEKRDEKTVREFLEGLSKA